MSETPRVGLTLYEWNGELVSILAFPLGVSAPVMIELTELVRDWTASGMTDLLVVHGVELDVRDHRDHEIVGD